MNFSAHALQRMAERGISAAWVLGVIASTVGFLQPNGTYRHDFVYLNIFGGLSSVTVIVDWTTNTVVTTWWN